METLHFVYIIECKDKTLYCGYTTDISRRLASHNSGKGCKYTRSRFPVKLLYLVEYPTKSSAMKAEWLIKKLSRKDKIDLINYIQDCKVLDEKKRN